MALELLHPIPSLLTTLAAMGFAGIFGIGPRDRRFWWIAAIMLLVQFSISALNEWADADLDRRAGRQRPIPLGLVSPGAALGVAVVCAVGAFLLCVLSDLGPFALLLVGVGTACGWAYDLWLKATPLSFVPFAIAFPLMPFWIGVLAGRPPTSLLLLFLGGSPLAAAIHLAERHVAADFFRRRVRQREREQAEHHRKSAGEVELDRGGLGLEEADRDAAGNPPHR